MRSYRDLEVWHKAYALSSAIYRTTTGFPAHGAFGMSSQLRRAAISVPTNIAEG